MTAGTAERSGALLDAAERESGKKFFHRRALAAILDSTENDPALRGELLFTGAFVAHAAALLQRGEPAETANLSREFTVNLERARGFIESIASRSAAGEFSPYLAMNHAGMESLLALMKELAVLKSVDNERRRH